MMRIFVLFFSILFSTHSLPVFAVEPSVPVPGKTPTKNSQDIKGAVKVETEPAVKLDEPVAPTSTATPPPVVSETSPEKATETTPEQKESMSHYFGFHGQLALPNPLNAGLTYLHSSKMFSFELETGSLALKVSGVDVDFKNTALGFHWHPFAGSFYLGALVGNRVLSGKKMEVISSVPITATVEVKSNYVTPVLGWLWGLSEGGFFFGTELGYQSPSGVTTSLTSNADTTIQATNEYKTLEKDVRDAGNKLGEIGLPHFVLIKLGWLF